VGSLAHVDATAPGLPRGRASLATEAVEADQRGRLLRAVVATVAADGFPDTTVGAVVGRARVSRAAFYRHFADRTDCLLTALADGLAVLLHAVESAAAAADRDDPVAALRAGLGAYLRFMAAEPEFARCFSFDLLAAGAAALDRRQEAHRRFAALTRAWHVRSGGAPLPDDTYLGLVGVVYELVVDRLHRGVTDALTELEPTLVAVHLAVLGVSDVPPLGG